MRFLASLFINKLYSLFIFLIQFYESLVSRMFGEELAGKLRERDLFRIEAHATNIHHVTLSGDIFKASIATPNYVCAYRAKTFSNKEPETLAWIDEFGGQGPFFDIGANVGLYSLYHAITKPGEVVAFEPSVFNLSLLVRNIYINSCWERVRVVTNPLSNTLGFADMRFSSTTAGGALNAFGVNYGADGGEFDSKICFSTLGTTLDELYEKRTLPLVPSMVKIDVDGIEHLILEGGRGVLSHPQCKTVLIEVSHSFEEQRSRIFALLTACGFVCRDETSLSDASTSTSNLIWVRV